MRLLYYICLTIVVELAAGARILAVLPMPAESHHHLFRAVLKTLAQRGHEIVSYTSLLMDKPVTNYTEIHLDTVEPAKKSMTKEQLDGLMNMSPVRAITVIWSQCETLMSKGLFKNTKFKELIKSDEKFDLVISEALISQEYLLGFSYKFRAPSVVLQPFGAFSLVNKVAGNSLSLSYIPDFSFPFSDRLTFYERLLNAFSITTSLLEYYTLYLPKQEKRMHSLFKDPTMPPLLGMVHNISLFINNAPLFVHYAQPYTPNIVSVGGIHLHKDQKPFPMMQHWILNLRFHAIVSVTLDMLMGMMNMSPVAAATLIWSETTNIAEKTFQSRTFQELLISNEKFDLIFLEALFAQEALLGLGHIFNAPIINIQPFGSFSPVNKVSGNTLSLAYIPDFSLALSDHMSFYERGVNAYSILKTLYIYYSSHLPKHVNKVEKYYKDPTMPPLLDMLHNISLTINNAHPYLQYSQPYTPNIVSVGGIHLAKEQKPLPLALKKFLDEAKHGVIYFALGSFLPDHLLPQKYFDNFINVFSRLPQRVLWKTGSELKGLPDNIMTAKWVPQQDVLAHPNVVLFMTHGGLFSQHEAINAGVPVVCTPYFGDQPMNARFYEEKGIGVKLLYNTLSEKTIYSAVTTVLNNPQYKKNMQHLSRIYRDRPVSPADSLVYWVEYVLRHKGAHHLQPASAHMAWYQLALLDVLVVILLAASATLLFLYLVIKRIFSFVRGNEKSLPHSAQTEKKKN